MSTPLVSVVICVYNGAEYLRQSIESALAQTHPSVEVVVVNDGSTDDSDSICRSYFGRIVYLSQKNQGLAKARNRGIRESSGTHIALLDQDDFWVPDKLEKQMALFGRIPELGLVYSDSAQIDPAGRVRLPRIEGINMRRGYVLPELYDHNFISSLTAVCPRRILDHVGLFSEDLRFSLDWDLWLRIAHKYPLDFVDEPLAGWRWRPNHAEDNHEICLVEAYRIISTRHPYLSDKLTPEQNAGVANRLARISFSLGRLYKERGDIGKSVHWLRTSIDHDDFSPDQHQILEEVVPHLESSVRPT